MRKPLYPHVPKRREPLYPHQREVPPRFSEAIDMIQAGSTIDEVVKAKVLTVEQADTLLPIYKKILANRHLLELDTDAAIKQAVLSELPVSKSPLQTLPGTDEKTEVLWVDVPDEVVKHFNSVSSAAKYIGLYLVEKLSGKGYGNIEQHWFHEWETPEDLTFSDTVPYGSIRIKVFWGDKDWRHGRSLSPDERDELENDIAETWFHPYSNPALKESNPGKEPFVKVGERVRVIGSSRYRYESWPKDKWLEYGVTGTVTEYHPESPEVRIRGEIFEALPQYAVVSWDLGGAADTCIDPEDEGKRWERI